MALHLKSLSAKGLGHVPIVNGKKVKPALKEIRTIEIVRRLLQPGLAADPIGKAVYLIALIM
jgi:hypothetical protein